MAEPLTPDDEQELREEWEALDEMGARKLIVPHADISRLLATLDAVRAERDAERKRREVAEAKLAFLVAELDYQNAVQLYWERYQRGFLSNDDRDEKGALVRTARARLRELGVEP